MFPIRDSTPRQSFPFVNYLIIAITIYAFFIQITSPDFDAFVFQYGFVPSRFKALDLESYRYILYSIFLHGGLFHIASNLWFLHIFGDNVEDRLGHIIYPIFYILAGVIAVFVQLAFNLGSSIPMIGASGAISGVAGAYFVLFRDSKIKSLVPTLFGFYDIIELPAWFFLGYWFVIQVFSGVGSLVTFDLQQGGVAFFAHIGGFVFGYLVAKLATKPEYRQQE
ncbi:rhomboid family intramembrane serine protease [Candidatus Roizmanbacteria bacterium]|nr:rhomboid family intramembrane serine protease [Candidatus Roizmanbacteria bacterium]